MRKLSLLLAAWSLCFAGWAVRAQTPASNPFSVTTDTGKTVRVVPTTDVLEKHNGKKASLAAHSNAAAVYPGSGSGNLISHGGPEIGSAGFQAIYYDSSVANSTSTSTVTSTHYVTIQDQVNGFVTAFPDNVNWDNSNTDDYTIIQQYGTYPTTPIAPTLGVNPLHSGTALVDTQGAPSQVTDAQIQTYIAGLLSAGKLPVNSNTIYGVFFPAGTSVQLSAGTNSCTQFCAYHSGFYYNGQAIIYAAFPFPNCGGCNPWGYAAADMLTMFVAHEVRESVTDAYGAWYDSVGYEADDKCAWSNLYRTANGNFFVQPEYSNGGTVTASGFTATYPGPGCIVPTGTSGPLSISGPASLPAGTVGVAYTPTTVTATGGTGPYSFSATGLPPGLSIDSSTGTITGTPTTSTGSPFSVTVTATDSASAQASKGYLLTINPPPPDFSISSTPSSTVTPPTSATYTVTTTALNGFTGTISFSVTGLPAGATPSFSPTTVTGAGSTTLTITTTTSILPGTYTLTIKGTSGALQHTASATLTINLVPGAGFTLSNSGNISITRPRSGNGSGTSKITVTRVLNYAGSVALTASGLPAQASQTLSPTSVSLASSSPQSSTLTISVNKKTAAGTYTITVTGTGSGVPSASTSLSFTVK